MGPGTRVISSTSQPTNPVRMTTCILCTQPRGRGLARQQHPLTKGCHAPGLLGDGMMPVNRLDSGMETWMGLQILLPQCPRSTLPATAAIRQTRPRPPARVATTQLRMQVGCQFQQQLLTTMGNISPHSSLHTLVVEMLRTVGIPPTEAGTFQVTPLGLQNGCQQIPTVLQLRTL